MSKSISKTILLISLTCLIVIYPVYAKKVMNIVWELYFVSDNALAHIFSSSYIGYVLKTVLAILVSPIYIVIIPSILYLFKNKTLFPGFGSIFFVSWVLTITTVVNNITIV